MLLNNEVKPIIRWAGSKKKLLPKIVKHLPECFDEYIEPFVGSGQLLLKLNKSKSTLGDMNWDLINFYKCLKNDYEKVYRIYISIPKNKTEYYQIRDLQIPSEDNFFDAARFLYLNENCFNGLYRVNLKGKFNVPYSAIAYSSGKDILNFRKWSNFLENCNILNDDFERVITQNLSENSFVYLDPPYAQSNKRIFTQYDTKTFGLEDIKRLDNILEYINNHGAKFLLSYSKSEEIQEIADKWGYVEISAYRSMAGFKNARKYQTEYLIKNYD